MRNVTRPSRPNSLTKNARRWTDELLNEINRCRVAGRVVEDKFYDKYNKKEVKECLDVMYNNYCCYCESKVGIVDYPHIEHRKPKRSKNGIPRRAYPRLTYSWMNLHLACTVCNTSKGTKYDIQNPILDSVTDVPIEQHFQYDEGAEGIIWLPLTPRGTTTEQHANLNRDALVRARQSIFNHVIIVLGKIRRNPANPGNVVALNELRKITKGSYGSLVQFLLNTF